MERLIPLLCLLLAACASPSHDYFGVPAQAVVIGGREYRVFVRPDGSRAQVIRLGWAGGRDHRPILAAMVAAAEQASGCNARTGAAEGDSGVLTVPLRC